MTITEFVEARLAEDETAAREAAGLTECWVAEEPAIGVVLVDGEPLIEGHIAGLTAHIARHDPAHELREVAFKRAILRRHTPVRSSGRTMCEWCLSAITFWPCPDLRDLAAIDRDHPDYDPSWTPNPA